MENNERAEFLAKLQALLAEYGACIMWTCSPSSDTHGIYDAAMVIDIGEEYEALRVEAGYVDANNLAEAIKENQA